MEEDVEAPLNDGSEEKGASSPHAKTKKNSLNEKKLEKLKRKYEKRGIVYISRLPPHMVCLLSSSHEIFLVESSHASRVIFHAETSKIEAYTGKICHY